MRLLLLLVSLLAVGCSAAKKTLVIVDNLQVLNSHSAFFGLLEASGHQLTYAQPLDEEPKLLKYGEYQFDNLVLFAPTAEDLTAVNGVDGVTAFLNSGRNVLLAAQWNASEVMSQLAQEVGLALDDKDSAVVDHFLFDASDADGPHSRVAASSFMAPSAILPAPPAAPVLFAGIGHTAERSRLVARVLTGAATTFSQSASARGAASASSVSAGADLLLVSALQMRNNARLLVSGSLQLFSNKFFAMGVRAGGKAFAKSGNEEFCSQVARWTLNGHGLLRASAVSHHALGSRVVNPRVYRVKDDIEFAVRLEQLDGASQQWRAFAAADVQLELVMIDPYIRTPLAANNGLFSASLTLPDVYGVYKFVVEYHRLGVGNLELAEQVSVRPFQHNEFERFIPVAFPYYASAFSTMAAFFVFGLVFLYSA